MKNKRGLSQCRVYYIAGKPDNFHLPPPIVAEVTEIARCGMILKPDWSQPVLARLKSSGIVSQTITEWMVPSVSIYSTCVILMNLNES